MVRFTMAICTWWLGVTGMAVAQPQTGTAVGNDYSATSVATVAPPLTSSAAILPPTTPTTPLKNSAVPPPPAPAVQSPSNSEESVPPAGPPVSPGEALMSREVQAHQQYLLQSQAQAESVHRAAVARAEQRTRRLESQRWFGISNSRPMAGTDPLDDDYSPFWVSNNPSYPFRWVGNAGWGFIECP